MKKLLLLFLTILLVACGKSPDVGDTSKISKGMSEDEVVDLLGKPDFETTDRNELETTYDTYISLKVVELDLAGEDYTSWDGASDISNAVENKENVKVYEYKLKENYFIHIYFLNNEVRYFYELDLSTDN